MAARFPLIANSSANQIQELASGDDMDLTGNSITGAGIITATSFSGNLTKSAVTCSGTLAISDSTDTTSSTTGALTVTGGVVLVTSGGTATNTTIADGVAGQTVHFVFDVDGGGIPQFTPTTKTGFTSFSLTAAGDAATLVFTTTRGWVLLSSASGSAHIGTSSPLTMS